MLSLINVERAAVGASPLMFDSSLQASSEGHSRWMIASDSFSHEGLDGTTATERMADAGYEFTGRWASGENIAWASLRSPGGDLDEVLLMHENLMNSPAHRANVLNPAFEEVGIGIEVGNMLGWDAAVVTQNFGHSSASPPSVGAVSEDPYIDDAFYLSRNADVAAAGLDPDQHYAEYGWKEGRDPNAGFSTIGYLAANPDVATAGINPLDHWLRFGQSEGRSLGFDLLL
ncbi:CAP domain-containing protein [Microvirga sp. GCM10011540]|uniref:CAP domain-containing protein n=1 Tax=Microvirga sp. GCM10011540 TaxID=3317338 RepID=UPI0036119B6F